MIKNHPDLDVIVAPTDRWGILAAAQGRSDLRFDGKV